MKAIGLVLSIALAYAGVTADAHAFEVLSGESVVFSEQSKSRGSLYAFGMDIVIYGQVDGDLVCAGQQVTVNGPVNGDILCAAQYLRLNGPVSGDLRVAGQNVEILGQVSGSVHLAAQKMDLAKGAVISRDLAFGAQKASFWGLVVGDVLGGAESVQLNGKFENNVNLTAETVTVGPEVKISGDFNYASVEPASFSPGQIVGMTRHQPLAERKQEVEQAQDVSWVASRLMAIIGALVISLFGIYFWSGWVGKLVQTAKTMPFKAILVGLLAVIVWPLLTLTLFVSVVGIPIAVIMFMAGLIIMIISRVISALWLGQLLAGSFMKKPTLWWAALLGVPLAWLIFGLPLIGFLASGLAGLLGVGVVIMNLGINKSKER